MQHPAYSFTIPSLHDDAALDCRIYHPQGLFAGDGSSSNSGGEEERGRNSGTQPQDEKPRGQQRKKAAIIAHPYAPLGGNYDDPVVGNVGAECLAEGWVVGTFGFR
ncbi:hypothetical protein SLS56_007523 [Neofusicoccum ribis]|uniref:Uncharacterized protein n=1 Tax=Neofusicoccum ribis TaxID=45134 RepID=A0ABR3SMP2_9PEZI